MARSAEARKKRAAKRGAKARRRRYGDVVGGPSKALSGEPTRLPPRVRSVVVNAVGSGRRG